MSVWLIVALATTAQIHTPPELQGRVNAAWTMAILTPQTLSIAAGAGLIAIVDYRILLFTITVVMAACAATLFLGPLTGATRGSARRLTPATEAHTGLLGQDGAPQQRRHDP